MSAAASIDQGLWLLVAAALPGLTLALAWAQYRFTRPDRRARLGLGAAFVALAWAATATMFHWTPPRWQPVDQLGGGILLALATAGFIAVAFPLTYVEAKGAWPAKLLAAAGLCLLLLPGTCFGAWIGGSATGLFGPYHP